MTEENTPQESTASEGPPPPRGLDELRADPRVSAAVEGFDDAILDAKEFADEITFFVERSRIRDLCESFKIDGYLYLVDLSGADYSAYPGHERDRFCVNYMLYSFERNSRIRLKVFVPDGESVPSVTSVWRTANWHERETFDMYGITFEGHPNLERILMWDEFNGHPLRKDFPVRGIDTGARIYPEVFPEGGGPMPGSTGKDVKDVNLFQGEWTHYGTAPLAQAPPPSQTEAKGEIEGETPPSAAPAGGAQPETSAGDAADAPAAEGSSAAEVKFHDESIPIADRMKLAQEAGGTLELKLFAAMAQTDCMACGWDCEGYGKALATGETDDITLCVPGEVETEEMLEKILQEAGKR